MKHKISFQVEEGSLFVSVERCTDPECYAVCESHREYSDLDGTEDCAECQRLKALGCWVADWVEADPDSLMWTTIIEGTAEVEINGSGDGPVIDGEYTVNCLIRGD